MSKGTVITIFVLGAILAIVGLVAMSIQNSGTDASSEAARALGANAQGTYTDLDGNPLSFDDYAGKVRVVNSWASWCPFCVNELPDLVTLANENKNNEVVVIAINRKESKEKAKKFLSTLNIESDIVFALDPTDSFYKSIGGFSMPETIFYDKEGNITTHKRGVMKLDEMRALTQKALGETKNK